ncbi:HNH endonuclease signature motif containing protein [Mesorhizobium sp. KR9-304]|uniref:HNH endonuclease signature motif containing protein n=1 Tax=Mesorhizobium sp. KR9-304 TaxID=3156614 RepID=UPI0032B31583
MSRRPVLTYERACEVLVYDRETGALNWRVARPGAPKGALVGTRSSHGYTQVEVDYRLYKAHRVIWLLMTGNWPTHQVDHINGMRADNRWKNLREATPLQNSRNRRPSKSSTSGRVGVTFIKASSKWQAYIGIDSRTVSLGHFAEIEKAIAAREAAEKKHYGEFAPGKAVAQ